MLKFSKPLSEKTTCDMQSSLAPISGTTYCLTSFGRAFTVDAWQCKAHAIQVPLKMTKVAGDNAFTVLRSKISHQTFPVPQSNDNQ